MRKQTTAVEMFDYTLTVSTRNTRTRVRNYNRQTVRYV